MRPETKIIPEPPRVTSLPFERHPQASIALRCQTIGPQWNDMRPPFSPSRIQRQGIAHRGKPGRHKRTAKNNPLRLAHNLQSGQGCVADPNAHLCRLRRIEALFRRRIEVEQIKCVYRLATSEQYQAQIPTKCGDENQPNPDPPPHWQWHPSEATKRQQHANYINQQIDSGHPQPDPSRIVRAVCRILNYRHVNQTKIEIMNANILP